MSAIIVCARPAAAQTTALFFNSQAGDYIGRGQQQTWTDAELVFAATTNSTRSFVSISATSHSDWWHLHFAGRAGLPLVPGVYESASRFQLSILPALDVFGNGRGCNRLTGRFVVHEITFSATGQLQAFAADFEQHCEDAQPALFGSIRYKSQRSSLRPFDGAYPSYTLRVGAAVNGHVAAESIMCGAGYTQCAATYAGVTSVHLEAHPNPGFQFLGWIGDCNGLNPVVLTVDRPRTCTPVFAALPGGPADDPSYAEGALFIDRRGGSGTGGVPGPLLRVLTSADADVAFLWGSTKSIRFRVQSWREAWDVEFAAPAGGDLVAGTHEYTSAAFDRGTSPYLSVGSCSGAGRLLIHEIAFTAGTLTRFAADFEVNCGVVGQRVIGSIRYRSTRSSLLPFDGDYPAYVLRVFPTIGGYVVGTGIDCGLGRLECDERFASAVTVPLQAVPAPGYDFLGWGGSCSGATPTSTVVVDTVRRCFAAFAPGVGSTAPSEASLAESSLYVEQHGGSPPRRVSVWLPADALVRVNTMPSGAVSVTANSATAGSFTFEMRAPAARLIPGSFEMPGFPTSATVPVLDVGPCSETSGRFTIYEAVYDSAGAMTSLAADFEAYCSGTTTYIVGAVRYRSTRASIRPFDGAYPVYSLETGAAVNGRVEAEGIRCGAGDTQCTASYSAPTTVTLEALPAAGYLFIGWTGDCRGLSRVSVMVDRRTRCAPVFGPVPGAGGSDSPSYAAAALAIDSPAGSFFSPSSRRVFVGDQAIRVSTASSGHVAFSVLPSMRESHVSLTFSAAIGALAPGDYDYALSFADSGRPGLGFSSCSGGGRFRVYEIAFAGSTLTRFAADFEMLCGAAGQILAGAIRYRAMRTSLLPFDGEYPTRLLRIRPSIGGRVVGTGVDCGAAAGVCEQRYSSRTTVPLVAIPEPGYEFMTWAGACAGRHATTTVTVDISRQCFAVFLPATGNASATEPSFAERTVFVETPRRIWLPWDNEISLSYGFAGSVRFRVESAGGGSFGVTFKVPGGLAPGDYEEAYPSSLTRGAVLDIDSCTEQVGRIRIYEATYAGSEVISFAADFEAHCTSTSQPYVVGAIRYRSSRPALRPFDGAFPLYKLKIEPAINGVVTGTGIHCGPGGTDCTETFASPTQVALRATPLPGYRFVGWTCACDGLPATQLAVTAVQSCSAVFNAISPGAGVEDPRIRQASFLIDAPQNEPVLAGRDPVWLDVVITADGRNTVTATVTLVDGSSWQVAMRAPGTAALAPGTYEDAIYLFSGASTASPRLRVRSATGASCSTAMTGRFVVHEITFGSNEAVTTLAADFEHRCTPTSPRLRGAIRFNSTRSQLTPFDTATSGGCTTPDPYAPDRAGICVGGLWQPPSPFSFTLPGPMAGCRLPDPFATLGGGTCYNGDWLPPGITPPNAQLPASPLPSTTGCATSDPFVALGGGTCANGNWYPPGMPIPGTAPSPTPPPAPAGCATPDPFVALGGGTCANGNWYPPGMAVPSSPPSSSTGCPGTDPFVGIPGLIGECRNGNWLPVSR